ncbi:MAG: IS66 family transposase [Planctomycetota bacterium]|jgi:hypothetical protein
MLENLDLNDIQDLEQARQAIIQVLNLVEELALENRRLREEVQRLRDENNRLKGEQGKPKIKSNKKPQASQTANHSSEQERRKPKERQKRKKVNRIQIDREEKLRVGRAQLPADAEFKGYEPVVVQDIRIQTDNIRFLKEKFYSPGEKRSYLAALPPGYSGEFGPGVKALTLLLYHAVNTSEPKVVEFFEHMGVQISPGQVSNLLVKGQDHFHTEKDAIYEAGLRSSPWQHIDDTATRVNGVNEHCHVVCNPLYTAYFTAEKKNRLTVLDVLTNFRPRTYLLSDETYAWLDQVGMSARVMEQLQKLPQDQTLGEDQFISLLDEYQLGMGPQQRSRVLEAAAVAAYHTQQEFPVVKLLIGDDAPQFKRVTKELALCWVHDARHYKKLSPAVAYHCQLLESFMKRYWKLYNKLVAHGLDSTPENAAQLETEFDDLFSTVTGYTGLDRRIAMTRDKKDALLMVLRHPEIPLHNNPAEIEIRRRVRKRDVSFGPRTEDGKRAWDTFTTLAATAKKLGVSFYQYVYDRVSAANQIPDFADLIAQRAKQMDLGTSWGSA